MGNCASQSEKTYSNIVPPFHTYSTSKLILLHYTRASAPYPTVQDLVSVIPEYVVSEIHKYKTHSRHCLLVSAMSPTHMVAKVALMLEVVDGTVIAQFGTLNVIEILLQDFAEIVAKFSPKYFMLSELIYNLIKFNEGTSNALSSKDLLRHVKKLMNS